MDERIRLADVMRQFSRVWLRLNDRSEKTISGYTTDLSQFVATVPRGLLLCELSRAHIEAWILSLRNAGYEAASIRRKLASLRALIQYCVDRSLLERTPMEGFVLRLGHTERLMRVVSEDNLFELIRYLKNAGDVGGSSVRRAIARRDYAIVRLMCVTGMRVGELVGLACDDVIDKGRTLRLLGKGRRERLAFLTASEDLLCLKRYLIARAVLRPHGKALFVNARGSSLTTEGVRTMLRTSATRAGVAARITPHMLRHTAATRLLQQGADIRIVQAFLGHASIRSTERYTHVSPNHLRLVLAQCHPLNAAA